MSQIKLLTGSVHPSPLSTTEPAVFRDTANRNSTDSMNSTPSEMDTSRSAPLASRPKLPPGVEEVFAPASSEASPITYRPLIFAEVRLHFAVMPDPESIAGRLCNSCIRSLNTVMNSLGTRLISQLTELAAFDRQPLAGAEFCRSARRQRATGPDQDTREKSAGVYISGNHP